MVGFLSFVTCNLWFDPAPIPSIYYANRRKRNDDQPEQDEAVENGEC